MRRAKSGGMRTILCLALLACAPAVARAQEPAPYCQGEYADDLTVLVPRARELERQPYSVCVRTSAMYECLSYADDGSIRRRRVESIAYGTAFGYKQQNGETLLVTNDHVAEWPAVTDDEHHVDGVPSGCKRVSDSLRVVDNESDDYEADDVPLTRVVTDVALDAAILKAKTLLPVLPWKIGRSALLRERNVVEVRGFPLGAFRATNVGKIVSAYDHDDEKEWDHDDFVIDALLSQGNSGSPVLAVSCKTGEYELVGVYHAGYTRGSALNVVIGIDQLRDLMTTLKRASHVHGVAGALDGDARATLATAVARELDPFFPLGSLAAEVRPRSDGALVFEVFARDFPFHNTPVFAYEELPSPSGFVDPARFWFGAAGGLKLYRRADLDADTQAQLARGVDAIRRDAIAFFGYRAELARVPGSREQAERASRLARTLTRTQSGHRDVAQLLSDLAERLAPKPGDPALASGEVMLVPPPAAPPPAADARPAVAPAAVPPPPPARALPHDG